MSTYLLIEFPTIEDARVHYMSTRAKFGPRCSCLVRSETDPRVGYIIFKDDVDQLEYQDYKTQIPNICKIQEIEL